MVHRDVKKYYPAVLPDFSWYNLPKKTKKEKKTIHQNEIKYIQMTTKYVYQIVKNLAIGCKMYKMVAKYTNIFHSKAFQKYTQIGTFGLQTYHPATLLPSNSSHVEI
jgi:hypothetical protein